MRDERIDTFTTQDPGPLSPRSVQKVLVLLHGVFKLAKRRDLIRSNPSADAERVTVEDSGTFNVLEPTGFEIVYRAALGELDERESDARDGDAIDALTEQDRLLHGAALSTACYAGLRLGELRDLQWRNVDFVGSVVRIEFGFTRGERSTPKGKRARATPMFPVLAERLAAVGSQGRFVRGDDAST